MSVLCLGLQAADYYVSSSDPNRSDAGAGSITQPWANISKVNATTFSPGDTIHFKSGDTWRAKLIPSSGGASSARITYTAYGTGDKPIISGADKITGWSLYSGGTSNTYSSPLVDSTVMVTANNTYLKKGTSKQALSINQYFWESGVLYVNVGTNPSSQVIEAAQRDHAIFLSGSGKNTPAKDYISIVGLSLQKTNLANVLVNQADYLLVEACDLSFGNNSSALAAAGLHLDTSHFALLKNNHINYALGDGILVWRSSDAEINGNLIENVLDDGEYGGSDCIQIGAKTSTPNACDNFKILNNIVSRPNNQVQKGCIIAEMGDNGVVSGNICEKGRFGLEVNGNDVVIEYNYVTGFGTAGGIRVAEDKPLSGIRISYNIVTDSSGFSGITILNDKGRTTNRSNFEIYNNIVYNTYYGIGISQPFSGIIKNNIVWSDVNTNPRFRLSVSSVIAGETLEVDHNIWQDKGNQSMIKLSGSPYYDLASWQATGHGANSTSAEPLWVDKANGDFSLSAASPAIDTGNDVGLTSDYAGNSVPINGTPDIGAYEYGSIGLLAYEGFDYTTGTVSGANGGIGWYSNWSVSGGAGGSSVMTGSLNYTGLSTSGNRFKIYDTDGIHQTVTRTLENTMGSIAETYWISLLAKKNATGREGYIYFGDMILRAYQSQGWDIKTPATSYTSIPGTSYGTLHFFLIRVDATLSGDSVYVWIDPDLSAGEPSTGTAAVTLNDSTGFSFDTVKIKHGPWGNSTQSSEWDEIRIGTQFDSVVNQP